MADTRRMAKPADCHGASRKQTYGRAPLRVHQRTRLLEKLIIKSSLQDRTRTGRIALVHVSSVAVSVVGLSHIAVGNILELSSSQRVREWSVASVGQTTSAEFVFVALKLKQFDFRGDFQRMTNLSTSSIRVVFPSGGLSLVVGLVRRR